MDRFRGKLMRTLGAIADPNVMKQGLQKMSFVLPTAGRSFDQLEWIQSVTEDLAATAQEIRKSDPTFTLADHPIIVIDQTDGDGSVPAKQQKWAANDAIARRLEQDRSDVGLKIVHVSMQDVNRMLEGSGLKGMFDTTGETFAGYGGARNMGFLLGPVIQNAVREGTPISEISAETIQTAIKEHALSKDAPSIFMGDDTDYVRPGGIMAKATLNEFYGEEYNSILSRRNGRSTMNVSSSKANVKFRNGLDDAMRGTFGNSKWDGKLRRPGMGCVTGRPRFCFNLPTGAEERHHTAVMSRIDHFSRVSHLSGDRQKSFANHVGGYMQYANMTEFYKQVAESDAVMPWNKKSVQTQLVTQANLYDSGAEVLTDAAKAETKSAAQKSYFSKLIKWRNENSVGPLQLGHSQLNKIDQYLQAHPGLDAESQAELRALRTKYVEGMQQAGHCRTFVDKLLDRLVPNRADLTPEQVIAGVERAIESNRNIKADVDAVRNEMRQSGIQTSQQHNRMVRDLILVTKSLGAGEFYELAGRLTE